MKRILVLSDTHGSRSALKRVFDHAGKDFYMFLHAGDHFSDAEKLRAYLDIPYRCARGNCDYGSAPLTDVIEVMGHRIFLTHGHKYADGNRLSLAALEQDCKTAVFGHTHCSLCAYHGGVLLFNPGSPAKPRDGHASYGIITVTEQTLKADVVRL